MLLVRVAEDVAIHAAELPLLGLKVACAPNIANVRAARLWTVWVRKIKCAQESDYTLRWHARGA
jgi:hypothetical protein